MSDANHQAANQALRNLIPARCIHDSAAAREAASLDSARLSVLPDLVIRPEREDQVGAVLPLATKSSVPITVRGAGSATTGSATPLHKGWVLDLSLLNQIAIDTTAGIARVGAGAITGEINRQAEAAGWFYPPDPSSSRYCTIGGNIATNAGGLRAAKYGVTRDYIMGLSGYLANGEPFRFGSDLRKFAAGYNLRDLLIGSEGTLAVITSATLRLIPRPAARKTFLAAYVDEHLALAAVEDIIRQRLQPSVCEFIDRQTVACQQAAVGNPPFTTTCDTTPAVLLVELDGSASSIEQDSGKLNELLAKQALQVRQASNEAEADALWQIRRTCSQAMFSMGNTKLNEDIVVPVSAYHQLIDYTLQLREETGLPTPTFGHAADGNFHVHIMYDRFDADACKRAQKGIEALMQYVVSLDGAITGEHGIGLAKSPFLPLQHPPHQIALMQSIKHAFDPAGILNPGKIFQPFHIWEHPRHDYRFPWDH